MLKIKVHGKELEVKLTPDGVFYIEGRKENAKTLKGLETKLNTIPSLNPNAPPIRVQHKGNLKQGKVMGKPSGSYSQGYKIKWDDGTRSTLSDWNLRKPMTSDQIHQMETLEQAAADAENAYNEAQGAHDDFEAQFDVTGDLRSRYING